MDEKKAAQFKRQNDFVKNSYDRFSLNLPKGKKEVIRQAAAAVGMSVNEYINAAITEKLEVCGSEGPVTVSAEGKSNDV